MNGWDRGNGSTTDDNIRKNNANMFESDFNMTQGGIGNNATIKSNGSFTRIPEAWTSLLNLNQLSANNQQMFQEHWANQNSTSSLASLLRTLSVQHNSNQFQSLPADWAQQMQALQNPAPQQQNPDSFQKLATTALQQMPYSGEKRTSESVMLGEQPRAKQQRTLSSDTMSEVPESPEFSKGRNSQHLHVLADVKLEQQQSLGNVASKAKSTTSTNARWNSWSHEEEVFLVVAVLDRFFRRGSLASSGKGSSGSQSDCWKEIQELYEKICQVWAAQPENRIKPPLISRSSSALCRHFKIMKVRAVEGDKSGSREGNFRKYLREWDTVFNVNGKLLPELY